VSTSLPLFKLVDNDRLRRVLPKENCVPKCLAIATNHDIEQEAQRLIISANVLVLTSPQWQPEFGSGLIFNRAVVK